EIFGPCCHLAPFDREEDAIARANASPYGLATTIWTQDLTRAHRVAAAIEVGIAWVNCWFLRDLRTAFGGAKQSGIGREGGVHGLEFYTELRNVCIKLGGAARQCRRARCRSAARRRAAHAHVLRPGQAAARPARHRRRLCGAAAAGRGGARRRPPHRRP